jgi:DnaJ-class molecular chaperone
MGFESMPDMDGTFEHPKCTKCDGSGKDKNGDKCKKCGGKGRIH